MDFLEIIKKLSLAEITEEHEMLLINMTPPVEPCRFAIKDIIDDYNTITNGIIQELSHHESSDYHVSETVINDIWGFINGFVPSAVALDLTEPWEAVPGVVPRLYLDHHDRVSFAGLVSGGTSGSTVFVIPEGYRPPESCHFAVACGNYTGRLSFSTSGTVKWYYSDTFPWVSLDGVSFYLSTYQEV